MKLRIFVLSIFSLFLLINISCNRQNKNRIDKINSDLLVVHAGSLSIPFKSIAKEFMKIHPEVNVMLEAYGSRTAARQVSDLKRDVDVLASADSDVIRKLLYPDFADFCIDFTTNEMVIVYTEKSKFKDEINKSNWYDVLLRSGVEFGHSDPNSDPCGYRAVMTMKLSEIHYGKKGLFDKFKRSTKKRNIRPKEVDLLAMIEAGEIDYLFIYRSVAKQHKLNFISLPPEISLVSKKYSKLYSEVFVDITGKKPGEIIRKIGSPMVYGITIPKSVKNREWAVRFLDFLFGDRGRMIMKNNGQPILAVPVTDNPEALPEELKKRQGI